MTSATPPHLVLAAHPGRCGSKYLARLLETAEDTWAHHEPAPTLAGDVWLRTKREGYAATRAERRLKVDALRQTVRNRSFPGHYAETSHMFAKAYADVLYESLAVETPEPPWRVDVVRLRRPFFALVRSHLRRGSFRDALATGGAATWLDAEWYYDSTDTLVCETPALAPVLPQRPAFRALSYLNDFDLKVDRLCAEDGPAAKHGRAVDCWLPDLTADAEHASRLIERLGLRPTVGTAIVHSLGGVNDGPPLRGFFDGPDAGGITPAALLRVAEEFEALCEQTDTPRSALLRAGLDELADAAE